LSRHAIHPMCKHVKISQLLFCLFLLLPCAGAQAIIIRHDKADSRYRVEESSYPQLFYMHTRFENRVCVATLIAAQWALTAAHCTRQTPLLETVSRHEHFVLTIAGKAVETDRVVLHPQSDTGNELHDVDLALIHLTTGVENVQPAQLNQSPNEQDQIYTLLGWGFSGDGTRGLQGNDGRMRRALNRVTLAGKWLEFLFDDPRTPGSKALDLEGVPGLGDSGSPALLETDDGLVVVGITVGELEEGEAPKHQGLYGTILLYERISSHLTWIAHTIAD
jgi:hypothetical protein